MLYGLLFVDESQRRHVNLKSRRTPALHTYFLCAVQLSNTLSSLGLPFTVLTNAPGRLAALADQLGVARIRTAVLDFSLNIPAHFRFYHAHFKLCAFRGFASGDFGDFPILLDLDIVCRWRPRVQPRKGLLTYDLTHDIEPEALHSLQVLIGPGRHRWFGGECLGGDPTSFSQLTAEIERLLPVYVASAAQLPHISDETIVSAALNRLAGVVALHDVVAERFLERWWSAPTSHLQRRINETCSTALIHLPADKNFIARLAHHQPTVRLDAAYAKWVRRKSMRNRLKVLTRQAIGKKLYLPQ